MTKSAKSEQSVKPIKEIRVGTDLSKYSKEQLEKWLNDNKGVHKEPELLPYLIHSTVFGYLKLLIIAEEHGLVVRPSTLEIDRSYELVKPPRSN